MVFIIICSVKTRIIVSGPPIVLISFGILLTEKTVEKDSLNYGLLAISWVKILINFECSDENSKKPERLS